MSRSVFMGTPEAAVPVLRAANDVTDLLGVITRPDRRRGRSSRLVPPPVKEAADDLGVDVYQPSNRQELLEALEAMGHMDLGIVAAFGMILPDSVLQIPHRGMINVHFSLLPRWRGAAPVEHAILAGDAETGVSLMKMDAGLDTGAILETQKSVIDPTESAGDLTDRLAAVGAALVTVHVPRYLQHLTSEKPQDPERATYASKIELSMARLSLDLEPEKFTRAVRAFNPRPGASLLWKDKQFKIWKASTSETSASRGALTVIDRHLVVGVGAGAVRLDEIQVEGGKRMSGAAWAHGRSGALGVLE